MALLGLFLLIGVVMKNAILMIDVALQLERERGVTPEEAIREACMLRLRPDPDDDDVGAAGCPAADASARARARRCANRSASPSSAAWS